MVTPYYDDKGKIFTQVVAKQPVKVVVQTLQHKICGSIYVRPGTRFKDELNEENRFLAVTEAVIKNNQNEELYRSHFLVINVEHIIWVIPEEEMIR